MTCYQRGCRNLEWRCKDCSRVVNTATFGDGWKKIEDGYPKVGQRVLAVDMNEEKPFVDTLTYFGLYQDAHDWSSYTCNTFDPTHWRDYPELPKD